MSEKKKESNKDVPKLICPIHGLIDAVNEDDDGFHCSAKFCTITRKADELE